MARARDMRPLWRDLILKVWGGDPLECPCCKGTTNPDAIVAVCRILYQHLGMKPPPLLPTSASDR